MRERSALLLLALVLAGLAAACSAGASPSPSGPTVTGAWVRASSGGDQPSAGYMTIANPGAQGDQLIGATSPGATSVEMHKTTTDMSGMTAMQPVSSFDIPAGGTITLGPGGMHLMIMWLTGPLTTGGTLQLNLTFASGATVSVQAEVR